MTIWKWEYHYVGIHDPFDAKWKPVTDRIRKHRRWFWQRPHDEPARLLHANARRRAA